MKDALIVFARVPEPGGAKTRLQPLLGKQGAAALYEACLVDALDQYGRLQVDVRVYFAPGHGASPRDWLDGAVSDEEASAPNRVLCRQQGSGLGARMEHAFAETFAAGYGRVVIVGTDHPTLPDAFVRQAFDALEGRHAVSIGPTDDGGFYLLGMTELYAELFAGMVYSHPAVFEQTLARASATAADLTVLPVWYDVDTPEAVVRLLADLEAGEGPAARRIRSLIPTLRAAVARYSNRR